MFINVLVINCYRNFKRARESSILTVIQAVAIENKKLKAENLLLKERLQKRNQQVRDLSGRLVHHQKVTQDTSKQIEMQQSCTQHLELLVHGLRMTMEEKSKSPY